MISTANYQSQLKYTNGTKTAKNKPTSLKFVYNLQCLSKLTVSERVCKMHEARVDCIFDAPFRRFIILCAFDGARSG